MVTEFDSKEEDEIRYYTEAQVADGVEALSNTTFFADSESELRSKLGSGRFVVLTSDITVSTQINEFGARDTLLIPENVTVSLANGADIAAVIGVTANNVTLRINGVLDANGANQTTGNAIKFSGASGGGVEGTGKITDAYGIGTEVRGGSESVTVEGVHIDRSGRIQSGTGTGDAVYFNNAENCHVRNCRLTNSWRGGVVFESSANGDADGCSAYGNTITGNAIGGWFEASPDAANRAVNNSFEDNGYQNGFGNVEFVGGVTVQSGGATVANNTFRFTRRQCIRLAADDTTVRGNECADWNQAGQGGTVPAILGYVSGTIAGGSISDNELDCSNVTNGGGIAVNGADGLVNWTIEENKIRAPPLHGIAIYSNNATTEGTVLRDNKILQIPTGGNGIYNEAGVDFELFGNRITLNGGTAYNLGQDVRHRDNRPMPSIDVTNIQSPAEGDGPYYDNGTTTGAADYYHYDGAGWVAT